MPHERHGKPTARAVACTVTLTSSIDILDDMRCATAASADTAGSADISASVTLIGHIGFRFFVIIFGVPTARPHQSVGRVGLNRSDPIRPYFAALIFVTARHRYTLAGISPG